MEGQYNGELYVDNEVESEYAFLVTPFDFSFIAGNPKSEGVAEQIHQLLFDELLKGMGQKEAIVFCPDEEWYSILDKVFDRHNGIKDGRKIFSLNLKKFNKCKKEMKHNDEVRTEIFYEHECGSTIDYPVCRVFKNDTCVSFCSAFMRKRQKFSVFIFRNYFDKLNPVVSSKCFSTG
ncbi:GNAT family N-acetyltransferase, partial [Clostridium tagluense]